MVAISLYRGNLHRVPDVPRQWLMPKPKISLKDFKILLNRRSRALARLRSTTATDTDTPDETNAAHYSNQEEAAAAPEENPKTDPQQLQLEPIEEEDSEKELPSEEEEVKVEKGTAEAGVSSAEPVAGDEKPAAAPNVASPAAAAVQEENIPNPEEEIQEDAKKEEAITPLIPSSETDKKDDVLDDKEKRKREVEEKLQILNARKHNLVQVLKQILNAEEELTRRSSMQGMAGRPSVPLQVDVTTDSGSMTRHATPRMGSESLGGYIEGGEADDVSNHNMHSRHLLRMNSTSPSSDSPHRRPAFTAVPHPSRAILGVAGSPSRFALSGQQGHPANLPTVSVSGTNYVASSPSPAASGGTSVFRDARLPSPWN